MSLYWNWTILYSIAYNVFTNHNWWIQKRTNNILFINIVHISKGIWNNITYLIGIAYKFRSIQTISNIIILANMYLKKNTLLLYVCVLFLCTVDLCYLYVLLVVLLLLLQIPHLVLTSSSHIKYFLIIHLIDQTQHPVKQKATIATCFYNSVVILLCIFG